MLKIYKIRAHHVIDFAAEELKKYLRMMMPESGSFAITYAPDAKDGFRLGLLEDFGLPFEGDDAQLDDVIHVDTTVEGGILAGSNPRSVLFAVYRFLRENGCRWLYPGVDGEHVPLKEVEAVHYHKLADHRYRGFAGEGSESQTSVMECIDYYTKLEMNVFMMEWFVPNGYYNRYYAHLNNTANRIPEPVSDQQVLQWKRLNEAEAEKRGLQYHEVGHGWTCRPFGFPENNLVDNVYQGLDKYTEEQKSVLALVNGTRDFFRAKPIYTNLCMSRADIRTTVANAVADYAETHQNVEYLHVWLADGASNQCECEDCQKMRPSDWYCMMLNEIDEVLIERGLDTKIAFCVYLDTIFAPTEIKLTHPERFVLLYCPISRSYTSSIDESTQVTEPLPYVRNKWKKPTDMSATLTYLRGWQAVFPGTVAIFGYHFWRHQYLDPGGIDLARRLYEDMRALRFMGADGYIENGSQRSGFPNAFPVYIFAETLMNRDCDFESVREDYFRHIYGDDWKDALALLKNLTNSFDFGYMEGEKSKDENISPYYNPDRVGDIDRIFELCDQEKALAEAHLNMPTRPQTVSWRLLLRHAEYCKAWAQIVKEKALGNNEEAKVLAQKFSECFGRHELEMERYYDHSLACRVLEHVTRKTEKIIID